MTFATAGGVTLAVAITYIIVIQKFNEFEQQFQTPLVRAVSKLSIQLDELKKLPHPEIQAEVTSLKVTLAAAITAQNAQIQVIHQKYLNELNQLKSSLQNHAQVQVEELQKVTEVLLKANHGQIPIGTVIAYAGWSDSQVQEHLYQAGWLVCDGRELPSKQYSALYQVIQNGYGGQAPDTFKLPDFRGVFLRGLDLGRQLDGGRRLGSYQEDSNQNHTHDTMVAGLHEHHGLTKPSGEHRHLLEARGYWFTSKDRNERAAMTNTVDDNQEYATTREGEHVHEVNLEPSGTHHHALTISGGEEARPKNYPVIYLIKF